jgi:hypothetical protein
MLTACPHLAQDDNVEIFRIDYPSEINLCHVYMEAQIFTPDSKHFVLHSDSHPHGGRVSRPHHHYYRCDLEDDCALTLLTQEPEATAPVVSPDGTHMYYVIDPNRVSNSASKHVELRRVTMDGQHTETLAVLEGPLPGTRLYPSSVYPLSSISSDGAHWALQITLKNRACDGLNYALVVFDIESEELWVPLMGPQWVNMHPQYCRSLEAGANRDIMVQHNHGFAFNANGTWLRHHSGLGMDIHCIRDDGTQLRDFPWGRNPDEICHGHQCWVGRSQWAIEQCSQRPPFFQDGFPCPSESPEPMHRVPLIAGLPGTHHDHGGKRTPGARRADLCRTTELPFFAHFATDLQGRRIIADHCLSPDGDWPLLCLAELPPVIDEETTLDWRPIADTKSLNEQSDGRDQYGTAHTHPFLSPDGKMAFFNSVESGILRPYLIKNIEAIG